MERRTHRFDAGPPPEKAESVLEHVAEGCGVRQAGRLCRVAHNTVARCSRVAGGHARAAYDELVGLSPPPPRTTEVQIDEKWSFVAKKGKNRDRSDPADDLGGRRDHVALDPEHKLVVAVAPGKRTAEDVEALVAGARRRA